MGLIMRNTKIFFLFTFFCHNIFCSETPYKQLTTFVKQPHLASWLDKRHVFIGGVNGFEIIVPANNQSIQHEECHTGVYDIALNKTRTQYAISLDRKLKCYCTHDHELLWQFAHQNTIDTPITFDSQNENQVIYSCTNDYTLVPTELHPNLFHKNVLHFAFPERRPISCKASETKIISFTQRNIRNLDIYTITKEVCGLSTLITNLRIRGCLNEIRYTPDGERIVCNFQKEIQIHDVNGYDTNDVISIPTHSPCIAFDCYSDLFIAFLTQDNVVSYYNCCTEEVPAKTILPHFIGRNTSEQNLRNTTNKRVSISPDGGQLLVVVSNTCIVIPIPLLTIFCGPETAKILLFLFCLTKRT